ncbi:MAG: hypothetical protein WEF53_00460 [Bacteroidota bacterium]
MIKSTGISKGRQFVPLLLAVNAVLALEVRAQESGIVSGHVVDKGTPNSPSSTRVNASHLL